MPPVMNGNNTNSVDVRERLSRARKFIDESYHLPLDLTEISRQACLSRYHFLRLFRDAFNTTPHQYLIQRRIEKAKELLRSRGVEFQGPPTVQDWGTATVMKDNSGNWFSLSITRKPKQESEPAIIWASQAVTDCASGARIA
jgi:AraC-like DNA-binding protein